ncbi:DNA polymerase II [Candidatus Woesearchaeota archaeon]|nr:DNA polymerase II [Candidatus Woesearchaeota archaeon]
MRGYIVYPTYKLENNRPVIHLFGRLENGESFEVIDNSSKPYFFIKEEHAKKVKAQAEKTTLKTFDGEPVVKVWATLPSDVPPMRREFEDVGIQAYEADIRFAQRYLIDKDIKGVIEVDGDYKKGDFVDRVYNNPRILPATPFDIKLKVVSIDIETSPNATELYSIAIYADDYKKVLLKKSGRYKNAECYQDEKALLQAFEQKIIELDPDIVTGWNFIDFDLQILKKRFEKNKLIFKLGRTLAQSRITITEGFLKDSSATIEGRLVLDGIQLFRANFVRLTDYKLETAAKTYLDQGKLITGPNRHITIQEYYEKQPQKLIDYNLQDAKLVLDILEKSNVLALTLSRSLITGMTMERVKASIASFDSLYLREARKRGLVCPSIAHNIKEEPIKGGYVMTSKPGIYDWVLVLDFKSLYPSVIKTYNIDPLTFKKDGTIEAPNGARFSEEEGILPALIDYMWKEREKVKKTGDKTADFAIKTTLLSFWGVIANPTFRFFSMEMANAITSFARETLKTSAKVLEDKGFEVIYGDTDSVFINTNIKNEKEGQALGKKLELELNNYFSKLIKKDYKRKSFIEIEFEKLYKRFLMPKLRHSEEGAKKRYAGLLVKNGKEKLDFTGLEFVRRDWTELAKNFQLELLDKIFHKEEVTTFVKKYVENVRASKFDKELIYTKALRKHPDDYTKTTPPHVKAARKLKKLDSNIIRYYITVNGPEPESELKSTIDYEHYIEKQIKPLADGVLVFYNTSFEELLKKGTQKTLFGY